METKVRRRVVYGCGAIEGRGVIGFGAIGRGYGSNASAASAIEGGANGRGSINGRGFIEDRGAIESCGFIGRGAIKTRRRQKENFGILEQHLLRLSWWRRRSKVKDQSLRSCIDFS